MRRLVRLVALFASVLSVEVASGQQSLNKLTLEELMDINITSVARTPDTLQRTAAAVTIITAEEIRRSGATNIPELLRVVPGLQVARFNGGSWAITARGFNSNAANKLLVQIDGRTVYSPIFSGTFWETQEIVLDEIDRIEVVRGPGATLYGANAVNGIINIITRSAHQTTQNYLLLRGGGREDLGLVSGRAAGKVDADTSYRVDFKYSYRDQLVFSNGNGSQDSTRLGRAGFRVDSSKGATDIMVSGDFYNGLEGVAAREDAKLMGGNILTRIVHRFAGGSELQLLSYYERDYRRVPLQSEFYQRIFDLDLQHHFQIGRSRITWGGQLRRSSDVTKDTPVLVFTPRSRVYPLLTAFAEHEVSLAQDRVTVTAGTKIEHNDFSGVEVQPSVRTSWLMKTNHSIWAAVSRAVRTPTRFDSDIRFGPPALTIVGNPGFRSESVIAYEGGYRAHPHPRLSLDAAIFYNVYDRLRTLEFAGAGRVNILNGLNARTRGVELETSVDATSWMRVRGNYSFLGKRLSFDTGHSDIFGSTLEANDPPHQFLLQVATDLPHRLEFDAMVRFVDRLPAPVVPRYTELDGRLGWNVTPRLELSLIGKNLLRPHHPEFGGAGPTRVEAERNIYGKIGIRF
jgi:iron complex outermembrane receptor protein